jgi:pimeloyl-ACP methyl ester carboxylesterase
MTRYAQWILVACLLCLVGCGDAYYQQKMLRPDVGSGKLQETLGGSSESLLTKGKITAARGFDYSDGFRMEFWTISASRAVTSRTDGESLGTVLLIHDLGQSRYSLLKLGQMLAQLGYDVVLPDLRYHGNSAAPFASYGAYEKYDLSLMMGALHREGTIHGKILAFGEGVGGSIAIQYAAIDPACMAVVAFEPYCDIADVLKTDADFSLMNNEDMTRIVAQAAESANFDPLDASALHSVQSVAAPVMLVHRVADLGYDQTQCQELYRRAAGPMEIVAIDLGGEDMSYALDPNNFLATLINGFATGEIVSQHYARIMARQNFSNTP